MLADQPLREVLQRMISSGRMVKWSIEHSEYGLEFRPRKSIKAQALADFMAECTFQNQRRNEQQSAPVGSNQLEETERQADIWSVYVDGSSA